MSYKAFDAETTNTDSDVYGYGQAIDWSGQKVSIHLDITNATVTLKSTNDPTQTVWNDVASYTADDHIQLNGSEADYWKLTTSGNTGTVTAWVRTYSNV